MKLHIPLVALLLLGGAIAANGKTDDTVGGLPFPGAVGASSPNEESSTNPDSRKQKVKPGNSHCNSDGVCVANGEESRGDAIIDPKEGSESSITEVDTKSGFEGEISGLDSNDIVNLGSSNTCGVTGTGGTVTCSGGSTVGVTNVGGDGATNMTVNLPSGSTVTVPPGSNVDIST